jgi:hypothetical protein
MRRRSVLLGLAGSIALPSAAFSLLRRADEVIE